MYPPPQGPTETPEQAQALDDTFLAADPFGYFVSRIGMLHAWALAAPDPDEDAKISEDSPGNGRADVLGVISAVMKNEPPPHLPRMVVAGQVAVDSFALRHHLAEALLRLFVACVEQTEPPQETPEPGKPVSIWARMTDDKNFNVNDVVKAAVRAGEELPPDGLAKLVLPPGMHLDESTRPLAQGFLTLCVDWLGHACDLLQPAELDITTAHNKVKHGLVVRGRADLKVTFTTVGPNEDGGVPLSAFDPGVSVDIFDRPVLEFLSRPKIQGQPAQGLEVTQLRLGYRELLCEASMMALVHGALFHVASHRHFKGRLRPDGLRIAPHPGLVSESPKPNHAGHQVGLRFPITTPPGGGKARPAGVGGPDGNFSHLTFGDKMSGKVIDDGSKLDAESNSELPEPDGS